VLIDGTTIGGGRDSGTFAIERDNHGAGLVRFRPTITTEKTS
jgi:hypothetical protein